MFDKGSQKLVYSNQLEFKAWARHHGLSQKNGASYYFDSIYAVHDNGRISQNNIPGVIADGKLTWNEACTRLKKFFNIAE